VDTLLGKNDIIWEGEFRTIHDMLLKYNDNNFVLRDFDEYRKRIETMEADYLTGDEWTARMLHNIALIGEFASDVVVSRYARKMQQTSK